MIHIPKNIDQLFKFSEHGTLIGVSKSVFDECREMIHALKNFENSRFHSSTQFVEKVNRKDLMRLVENNHSNETDDKLKNKLDIIECSAICNDGDFIVIIVDDDYSINKNNFKRKSVIILRVAQAEGVHGKLYDCCIHTVSFELTVSLCQFLVNSTVTVAVSSLLLALDLIPMAISTLGTGVAYTMLNTKPHMPEFVEHALNALLVDGLREKGYLNHVLYC